MPDPVYLNVAIAAEQAIVRRGLSAMIQSVHGVRLLGEARNLQEVQELCSLVAPDLLLLDYISLEQARTAVSAIRQRHPNARALLLVDPIEQECVFESAGDDLIYFLSRSVSEEEFSEVLQHIGLERAACIPVPYTPDNEEPPAVRGHPRSDAHLVQELAMAGQIQANILPEKAPSLPGYDVAARLLAARETSGDFYDFIPVSDRNWGIIIADVADKGMGAALFMTLTSTLFRGFAPRHPTLPALTLDAVNERILSDTRGSMFVTAFYGVLEPHIGRLRYANAGHPPPILIKSQRGKPVDRLSLTGMALGVKGEYHWKQKFVTLAPGDVLVLYTDGVTEAQDPQGDLFEMPRLQEVVRRTAGRSAKTILDAILNEVQRFTAGAPGQDDIAIVVIRRKE